MKEKKFYELLVLFEKENDKRCKWIVPEYTDNLNKIISFLLGQIFNEAQIGWVEWWIYDNDFGKKQLFGTQETDNEKITIKTKEDLWKALRYLKKYN